MKSCAKIAERRIRSGLALVVLFVLLVAISPSVAGAATFVVTTTADGPASSPTTDGVCSSTLPGNPCTLRAAFSEASNTSGDDVITLPAGTYGLDSELFVFDSKGSLTINGAGAATTAISSGGTHRMLVALDVGTLTFNGVTVENGGQVDTGGAIFQNGGHITFNDSVIRNNKANQPTKNVAGGAIYILRGDTTFNRTTITGNQAAASSSFSANGGAIGMNSAGTLTIVNSTLTLNFARRFTGDAYGGALGVAGGQITILNSTFSDNFAANNSSTIQVNNPTPFTIKNSIFQSPTPKPPGSQCSAGAILSPDSTGNIDTEDRCVPPAGNQVNTDPKLNPFGDYGGPTPTFQPMAGSPALNKVTCAGLATDQRGFPRPAGSMCDIGSVETSTDLGPAVTSAPPGPVAVGTPFTVGFTVTNAGPDPSTLGTMTFTPSAGTSVQSATSAGGCSVGATTVCNVGGLAKGASTSVSLTLVAGAAGQAGGTAVTSSAPEDLNGANDTAVVSVAARGPEASPPADTPPPADSDGDGVPDNGDNCPTQPGPASTNGCPLAPPADTQPPGVSGYRMTNTAFKVGRAATPLMGTSALRRPTGTKFKYTLSEPARVTIDMRRLLPGRKKGARCVKPTFALRNARRCNRTVSQGKITRISRAGANSVAFSGRVGTKVLKPGRYQAVLRATDAAGNAAAGKTVIFRVL